MCIMRGGGGDEETDLRFSWCRHTAARRRGALAARGGRAEIQNIVDVSNAPPSYSTPLLVRPVSPWMPPSSPPSSIRPPSSCRPPDPASPPPPY